MTELTPRQKMIADCEAGIFPDTPEGNLSKAIWEAAMEYKRVREKALRSRRSRLGWAARKRRLQQEQEQQ